MSKARLLLAEYVVARLPDEPNALETLHLDELVLACACALGNATAIALFEARYFDEVPKTVRRMTGASVSTDELAQLLRLRLFVDADGPPAITRYNGAGSLRAWIRRVVVSRLALNAHTRRPREAPVETELLSQIVAAGDDVELALVKVKYRAEFREAVSTGLNLLDPAVSATREALATRIGAASGHEVDSIIRLIQSRFDLTLGGLLRAEPD